MSVEKRPNGQWRARYRDAAGKEHSRHFARKVDAVSWERDQRAAVARGTHVDPAAGRETVRAYGERWRLAQVQHRHRTVEEVERAFRLHIFPVIGDRRLSTIRQSDITGLVAAWSASAAPNTVRSRYTWLRALFSGAVADGVLGASPCPKRVKLPQVDDTPVIPLTVDQVRAIHDAIVERYRPAILAGAGCGLRVSEVLGLTKPSVRFLDREIEVTKQLARRGKEWLLVAPKSRRGTRVTPAPDFLLTALSPLAQAPGEMLGTLFHRGGAKGEPVSRSMVDEAFADAVKIVNTRAAARAKARKAGRTAEPELPTVPAGTTFHDLRHHYVSLLIDGGESVTVVAHRIGDTEAVVLKTYSHLWPDSADRTRRIVDAAWSSGSGADKLRTSTMTVAG